MRYDQRHRAVLRFNVQSVLPGKDNLQLIGPLTFLRPPNIEQPTYYEDGYLRSFILRLTLSASTRSFVHRLAFTSQRRCLCEASSGSERKYHIFSTKLTHRDVQLAGRQDIAVALTDQHFHEAITPQWFAPLVRF